MKVEDYVKKVLDQLDGSMIEELDFNIGISFNEKGELIVSEHSKNRIEFNAKKKEDE